MVTEKPRWLTKTRAGILITGMVIVGIGLLFRIWLPHVDSGLSWALFGLGGLILVVGLVFYSSAAEGIYAHEEEYDKRGHDNHFF